MLIETQWLERLLAKRLIFVTGKGGAGKTTLSIALGMSARRAGKRVLLAEIGDGDAIGPVFTGRTLPESPVRLGDCIWGARINPTAVLEAYTRFHIKSGFIAERITKSRLFEYLAAATPGLKEVMSLGRIRQWEKATDKRAKPVFDLIIVDSPATGHGVSLLRLPGLLIDMIRVGPVASQIRSVQRLLRDVKKTALTLVTLPEELPVNEALEFYTTADEDLRMPVSVTFINSVVPSAYSRQEARKIDSLIKNPRIQDVDNPLRPLLLSARRQIIRRGIQQGYIDQIRSRAPGDTVQIPFCYTNNLTLADIERISLLMAGPGAYTGGSDGTPGLFH